MKKNITLLTCLLLNLISYSQTLKQRSEIVSNYDLEKLDDLKKRLTERNLRNKEIVRNKVARLGIKESFVDDKGSYYELMYFDGDFPIYYMTHNAGSAVTARVDAINTGGSEGLDLNGQNMIVGVWDGGPIRRTHLDLGSNRVVWKDNQVFSVSDEETSHAVHVAGTIISSGQNNPAAKGLAYEAQVWGNTFANDEPEIISQVSEGLILSNHSYGIPATDAPTYYLGAYISQSKEWDDIHFNAPYYQAVLSAGNDRGKAVDTKGGRDLLVGNKNSKNTIVVAAVGQVNNYTDASSVVMSSFSSWGPTDDYRIKPDISAKGVNVLSLDSDSDIDYGTKSGTSMASPAVTAVLTLFQQHYNNLYQNFMRASTLKAVMINSADEAGDFEGPDYKFGWGLINAKKGVEVITNKNNGGAIIEELNLLNGQTFTKDITYDGSSPLRITVVWTDPSGSINTGVVDQTTSRLVNDLDVRVVKGAEINYPWVLNSYFVQSGAIRDDNPYDNVESVDVLNPSGDYQIVVSHKGNLVGGSQNFSLVVSGVNQVLSTPKNDISVLGFQVYPNPLLNDVLNLKLNSRNLDGLNQVLILDMQARVVKQFLDFDIINNNVQFNVSDLVKGVYFVGINVDGKMYYEKMIKN
ncbi:S8 family serine peptidase [Flavobacterium sediminilitoris]|uniref:S8 family serine peptidase n=1 Tax=Flavobacterium sediminilitoris TaxID=2024526 RepID=A0ABY4HK29_9FLAO|nr:MULTISPECIES: S8 family serine peptidase [Flavobacterium]UOX32224.1 S8 family serine peptidase [Flavobacterium sediminilitoris]